MFSIVEILIISLIAITLGLCVFLFIKINSLKKRIDSVETKFSPLLNYYEEEDQQPKPPSTTQTTEKKTEPESDVKQETSLEPVVNEPKQSSSTTEEKEPLQDIISDGETVPKTPPNSPVNDEVKEVNESDSIVPDVDGKEQN